MVFVQFFEIILLLGFGLFGFVCFFKFEIVDFFDDGLGGDVVGFVEGCLDFSASVCFIDGGFHGRGDDISKHDDLSVLVSGGAANGLEESVSGSEKSLFVGVQNGDEGNFWEVESFAQKVDANNDVDFSQSEVSDDFDAVEGVDF